MDADEFDAAPETERVSIWRFRPLSLNRYRDRREHGDEDCDPARHLGLTAA